MNRTLLCLLPLVGFLVVPNQAQAQRPFGTIAAEPNPCRILPGEDVCTAHITWNTQNVTRAKVIVRSKGRDSIKENEFGSSLACESRRCCAPWIRPHTRYTFTLYDLSRGDRGRQLASVTVRGERAR